MDVLDVFAFDDAGNDGVFWNTHAGWTLKFADEQFYRTPLSNVPCLIMPFSYYCVATPAGFPRVWFKACPKETRQA
jgi:hypothetical protein